MIKTPKGDDAFYKGMGWSDVTPQLNQMWKYYQEQVSQEIELRKKYPALQIAWERYQNVKAMCMTDNFTKETR
jgi:hypothetical protein